MIVDMIRNDLGRIARSGSVRVDSLFDVTRYPSLLQMTSNVLAETDETTADVFAALFPCASVTGAPKVRTSHLIAELEQEPRGIYTGAMGVLAPGRNAQFNVAIRTLQVDRERGRAFYGTGSGIVWDSDADREFEECRTKALVLQNPVPPFQLFETLRWEPGQGYLFLDHHLRRLTDSATYFQFHVSEGRARKALEERCASFADASQRVRLLVDRHGTVQLESTELLNNAFHDQPGADTLIRHAAVAETPVDAANPFLFHKTTYRDVYDEHLARHPDADDIILWNEQGEITETCVGNVVIYRNGSWVTPPVCCGLLGGTYRAWLLEHARIEESVIRKEEVLRAEELYMINSVRGWVRLEIL
jgi:para-aminobenzoate synthetase/4-amino-4-deoxychorismate lyase